MIETLLLRDRSSLVYMDARKMESKMIWQTKDTLIMRRSVSVEGYYQRAVAYLGFHKGKQIFAGY